MATAHPTTEALLSFYSLDHRFLIPVSIVDFIDQDRNDYRRVPESTPTLLGISRLRGTPVPLYDLERFLATDRTGEDTETLLGLLAEREQDHVDWMDALEQAIVEGTPFTKARDPHACAFGRWYDAFQTENAALARLLRHFDVPHRRIHALADQLLELAEQGEQAAALAALGHERNGTFSHLRKLFDMARAEVRMADRKGCLYLYPPNQACFALRVQGVGRVIARDELEFSDSTVLQDAGWIEACGRLPNEPDHLLVEPVALLDLLRNSGKGEARGAPNRQSSGWYQSPITRPEGLLS